jgi:hypothetical protein
MIAKLESYTKRYFEVEKLRQNSKYCKKLSADHLSWLCNLGKESNMTVVIGQVASGLHLHAGCHTRLWSKVT